MSTDSPGLHPLVQAARRVATEVIAPAAERLDAEAAWPRAEMRALADAGLLGLHVPQELGGHGLGLAALVAISREIARESASAALCYAMHCVGTAVLAAKATKYHRERYLRPIARGEHITTLALSEPGTGSHFYIPEARLDHTDDGFLLDGTKTFITNGGEADSYVMSTADIESGAREGMFSLVVVDGDSSGLEWQEGWRGFGMRSNSSRTVVLRGVPVPRENLLGSEGDQLWYVFEVVAPYFLMAMAGTYLGVAEAAVELARDHVGSRRHTHTGELLGHDPVIAHRLGRLWVALEGTRRSVEAAGQAGDDGEEEALTAIMAAKVAASDAAVQLTNDAMTLAGGRAYGANSKLARLLRDARASHVMAPTTDVLLTWIGRALLGLPLL